MQDMPPFSSSLKRLECFGQLCCPKGTAQGGAGTNHSGTNCSLLKLTKIIETNDK